LFPIFLKSGFVSRFSGALGTLHLDFAAGTPPDLKSDIVQLRFQIEEMFDLKNGEKEGGKSARSNQIGRKRTKSIELWSDSCGTRWLRG
jgi:hypothetical protein